MKKVYAFDFDGTLTTCDTLLAFIRFTHGTLGLLWGFFLHSPWLVAMKLGRYPNWKIKQRIFSYYYKGFDADLFADLCRQFAKARQTVFRPQGAVTIRTALAAGADVVVVSASIEDWVRPFFDEFGQNVRFACTRIETEGGRLTGRFLTSNCYGEEKVRRIEVLFPQRESYHLTAFGDSRGDKELLEYADEGHYKPFRNDKEAGNGSDRRERLGEIVRFGIVGVLATALQYAIYLAMLPFLEALVPSWGEHTWVTVANTVAYLISFAFNFVASTRYTFKVKANAKRGAGFVLSHAVNYSMQTLFLNVFVLLGLTRQIAMLPTLCICVPVNFVLVRFFLKR